MAEILTQDEIDALLNSVTPEKLTDEKDSVSEKDTATPPKKRYSVYDFKRPDRFSKDAMRSLRTIHEKMARNFSSSLSAYLRLITEVTLESIEQVTYGEFLMSLPDITCFNIISFSPLNGNAVLELSPSLIFPIIDKLMGGTGVPMKEARELTDLEEELMMKIVNLAIDEWVTAWTTVIELEMKVETMESSPNVIQIVAPNEIVAMMTFNVTIGEASGLMNMCIPALILEPIMHKMNTQDWFSTTKSHQGVSYEHKIIKNLLKASVEVEAILDKSYILVRDLLTLEVGDIIPSPSKINNPITLTVEKKRKFKTIMGISSNRKAVQILSSIDEDVLFPQIKEADPHEVVEENSKEEQKNNQKLPLPE